jgi:hypothetical protein
VARSGARFGKLRPDCCAGRRERIIRRFLLPSAGGAESKDPGFDNHDDFGGHAKRNEFHSGNRLLIGYGGTQTITGPNLYSPQAKQLFKDLGIEVEALRVLLRSKFLQVPRHGAGNFLR